MLLMLPDFGTMLDSFVTELGHMVSPEWWRTHWMALFNILMIDLTLAGDNAIVVGMAAARVHPAMRAKVIFWGIAGAVVLRILFSGIAQQMLQVIGLTLAGGLLLLFVCWKMYRQLRSDAEPSIHEIEANVASGKVTGAEAGFWSALWTIILADLSMSLDNVLAVAGAAGSSTLVLVLGLAIAIVLMAVASSYIARLLHDYPWIAWVGLLIIFYVALDMIYRDTHRLASCGIDPNCKEMAQSLIHTIAYWLGLR